MEVQLLEEPFHLVLKSREFVLKLSEVHRNGREDLNRRSCRICFGASCLFLISFKRKKMSKKTVKIHSLLVKLFTYYEN